MPTIEQLSNVDLSGYSDAPDKPIPPASHPEDLLVRRSAVQICSLPFLPGTFPSTDSIVGYSLNGKIPQWRAPLPSTLNSGGGSSTTSTSVTSSSSSSTTNNPPVSKTASVTSPVLSPSSQFTGSIILAKSFLLLQVSVSASARVRLYSTASAQTADLTRSTTTPPGMGTQQGLIADLILPVAPTVWASDPAIAGSNGDTPQSNLIYVTLDNLGAASESISATLVYVPLQS